MFVFGTLHAKHKSLTRSGDFHAVQVSLQCSIFYSFDYRYSQPLKWNEASSVQNKLSSTRYKKKYVIIFFYFFHLLCLLLISQPAFLRYVCCPVLRLSFMVDYFGCIYYFNAFYTNVALNTLPFLSLGLLFIESVGYYYLLVYYLYLLPDVVMLTDFLFVSLVLIF
jgi:hypothetical protein